MTLSQADQDFASDARAGLVALKTDDLEEVLTRCAHTLKEQVKLPPSREGSEFATIHMCAAIAIVEELTRRENPNGDVV